MYQNAAILATLLVIYSAVSARVERSWLGGPMLFAGAGLILGPVGLDLLQLNVAADGLRTMAEGTLALVLFTDAADADFGFIKRNLGFPSGYCWWDSP